MDTARELSAFEVYNTKQKCVQPLIRFSKPKRVKKTMQNNKIGKKDKYKKTEKLHNKTVHSGMMKIVNNTNLNDIRNICFNNTKFYSIKSDEGLLKKKKKLLIEKDSLINFERFSNNGSVAVDKIYSDTLTTTYDLPFDPAKECIKLFEWLIYPLMTDEFFEKNWEIAPLHIKRNKPKYYKSLMSTPMLDKILRDNYILFTKNLDITSYTNNIRETHNPPGRALPSVVWDYFANGCSVRLLNPQTYIQKLHTLNATLQEFFGCFIGANSYLTPPNSQGFAPHYDDIEAFILQIEGKKRWRLYKPKTNNHFLPRYSSPNFSQSEIGEPILDTVVNSGDLLYFPRGTIHQGDTIGFNQHSLHITLSVYQKNSWGDFLEKLIPAALKDAIENDVRFRKGLPLNYLSHIGIAFSHNQNNIVQLEMLDQTKFLLNILFAKYINIDKAADEMAKSHIHDFLPPVLSKDETLSSVYEGGERMIKDGVIINRVEIEPDTYIRLSRGHCARLVEENGSHRLYYSCENSKEYHEYELQFLEIDLEFVPAIREIIIKYPHYTKVDDLPIIEIDKRIQLIRDLWEKAIVISKQPLPIIED